MTEPSIDLSQIKRLLIIKLSAMGDILHAIPVSAAIGREYPGIEMTWVVEEGFASLLEGNPYLSRVISVPKLRPRLLRHPEERRRYFQRMSEIQDLGCELALDLQGLTKSALIARFSGAKHCIGYHYQREASRLLVTPVPVQPGSVHVVDQYLDVAAFAGAQAADAEFPFAIPGAAASRISKLLCHAGITGDEPFVSINPAAGHPLKQWGAERFGELARTVRSEMACQVVLVTADTAVAKRVVSAATGHVLDLSGKTDLKELAEVIRRSAVHVCGDTGSGHLAAALGVPVVSLFGPTDPVRVCPYKQGSRVVSHRELCSPSCAERHCAYARPQCLDAITVTEVAARVSRMLADERDSVSAAAGASRE